MKHTPGSFHSPVPDRPRPLRYIIITVVLIFFVIFFFFLNSSLRGGGGHSSSEADARFAKLNDAADHQIHGSKRSNNEDGPDELPQPDEGGDGGGKSCGAIPSEITRPDSWSTNLSPNEQQAWTEHRDRYRAAAAAANCPTCRSWPSFLPFRSRRQCRDILSEVASIPAFDLADMRLRDKKKKVLSRTDTKSEKKRKQMLKDRRPSAPFITGDGFRAISEFIFDETTVPTWDALDLKHELKKVLPRYGRGQCERLAAKESEGEGDANHDNNNNNNNNNNDDDEVEGSAEKQQYQRGRLQKQKVEQREGETAPPNMWAPERDYRAAPTSRHLHSRAAYWRHVTGQVKELTEAAALEDHTAVLKYLRFECAHYGSTVFVQTHLLDKFIDEVLPIFELRLKQRRECEVELARLRREGKSASETAREWRQRLAEMPCAGRRNYGAEHSVAHAAPEFVLITHNSDYSAPWDSSNTRGIKTDPASAKFEKQISRLLASPLLLRWFGQNMVLSPQRQARILQQVHAGRKQDGAAVNEHHLHREKLPPLEILAEWKRLEAKLIEDKNRREREEHDKKQEHQKKLEHNQRELEQQNNQQQQQQHNQHVDDENNQILQHPAGAIHHPQQRQQLLQQRNRQRAEKLKSNMMGMSTKHGVDDAAAGAKESNPFSPYAALRREVARRRKLYGKDYHWPRKEQTRWRKNFDPDEDQLDFLALHKPKLAARNMMEQRYPDVDLDALRYLSAHPKPRLGDGGVRSIEAKLVPVPIGLENRYNRYGAFVDREYAIAAGCHNKDAYLFDVALDPDTEFFERKQREMAVKFEENLATMKRETGRPFVSFSVKTNKREREEAVRAVANNFAGTSSSNSELDKCVSFMTEQMGEVVDYLELQKWNKKESELEQQLAEKRNNADDDDKAPWDTPETTTATVTKRPEHTRAPYSRSPPSKYQLMLRKFVAKLKCHAFTLAPHGHGVDTHRFWEALYAGSIPISAPSAADQQLLRHLPALILGNKNNGRKQNTNREWYKTGTYTERLKPAALHRYWCKAAKGENVAGRLRWYDLEETRQWKSYEHHNDAFDTARLFFTNSSLTIPVEEGDGGDSIASTDDDLSERRFVPEMLQMDFWAHFVTRAVHPFLE